MNLIPGATSTIKDSPIDDPNNADSSRTHYPRIGLVYDPDGVGIPRIQGLDIITEPSLNPQSVAGDMLPSSSPNEKTRLKMLRYYTRGLSDDQATILKITQLIDLARLSIEWDGASAGLLEANSLHQFASIHSTGANFPCSEKVCSYILNHDPGTVLTLEDPSPTVAHSLSSQTSTQSYAGAQIRLSLHDGTNLILGCLCIFSQSPRPALTNSQKSILVHSADMITSELVTRTRINRLRERQVMTDALTSLRSITADSDIESRVIDTIQPHYPEADIAVAYRDENSINVPGYQAINLGEVEAGLWENTSTVDTTSEGTIEQGSVDSSLARVIVGQIPPRDRFLVVLSVDENLVFDDLDVWFIDQCAQIIHVASQAYVLKEALVVKERFLRSVTHELRTPIHGVLSAADLLSDELTAQKALAAGSQTSLDKSQMLLETFLQTIRRSGSELMRTVNDILRFNTFASSEMTLKPTDYDLQNLERDVTDEIMANFVEDQLQFLSIRFENQFPAQGSTVIVDADLLKEVMKYLLFNALTAVTQGTITVTTKFLVDESTLEINVTDTGTGIGQKDKERIFLAFEKADTHSHGVGLGLNLANKVMATLGGRLSLASSELGRGSRFQIKIPGVKLAPSRIPLSRRWSVKMRHIPGRFTIRMKSDHNPHLVAHMEQYLLGRGMLKSETAQGSLIIINQSKTCNVADDAELRALNRLHMMMVIHDNLPQSDSNSAEFDFEPHFGWPITGPFFGPRLDGILVEADRAFGVWQKHRKSALASTDQRHSEYSKSVAQTGETSSPRSSPHRPSPTRPPLINTLSDRPSLKALLVDDNSVNLSVLEFFCKKRKIRYGSATDGSQAFDSFSNSRLDGLYNLVLMDLQMPVCDGLESCRLIREFEAKHDLPRSIIYIVTGQDSIADRNNSFKAGADDYFVKPVSLKKLEQAIIQAFPENPT